MPRLLGASVAASLMATILIRISFRPRRHYLDVRPRRRPRGHRHRR